MVIFICDKCNAGYESIKINNANERVLGIVTNSGDAWLLLFDMDDKIQLLVDYMLQNKYDTIHCDVCDNIHDFKHRDDIMSAILRLTFDRAFENVVYWMEYFKVML